MGSYTDLSISGYTFLETKSSVIPEVMTIFRESDKCVFTQNVPDSEDDEQETAIIYSCETSKVIDRLNVMGFSIRRARKDFESMRQSELEKYASWAEEESEADWFSREWELLKTLTFEDYMQGLNTVLTRKLSVWPLENEQREQLDPIVNYILGGSEEYYFGFLCTDIRSFLRIACELVEPQSRVVQDITELVSAGYYSEEEAVCSSAILALTAGHPENSSRIILTEGSTDAAILSKTLDLLYPHLSGYYSFLDFGGSRPQGGAGSLVTTIKAFAAAGITNRLIAVFDNDTAAFDARRSLDQIRLPANIAVLNYPDLELLRSYPTLGPGGASVLDVNGLAASIELYLGEDVLSDGGTFAPVQWKGYIESVGKYQGEVMHKSRLHTAFQQKLERCKSDRNAMDSADWSGLRSILQGIFTVFE